MLEHCDHVSGLGEADSGALVGFAPVLTDRTYKAMVFTVIVAAEHRGWEAGWAIVETVLRQPDLGAVRRSATRER
jgi:hypothetical protein